MFSLKSRRSLGKIPIGIIGRVRREVTLAKCVS
jgi:hypothetical protein